MISCRTPAFKFTMSQEGGLSLDARDGGNYTSGQPGFGPLIGSKFGVSAPKLAAFMRPVEVTARTMANITMATAEAIWTPDFWAALSCDTLVAGLDLMVCDHGFNRGTPASAKVLQRLCGTDDDGWVGQKTRDASSAWIVTARPPTMSADAVRRLQIKLGVGSDGILGPNTSAALRANTQSAIMISLAQLADAQLADYKTLYNWPIYSRTWTARVWERLGAGLAVLAIPADTTPIGGVVTQAQLDALTAVEARLRALVASLGAPPLLMPA